MLTLIRKHKANAMERRAALPPGTVVGPQAKIGGQGYRIAGKGYGYLVPLYEAVRARFDEDAVDRNGMAKSHQELLLIGKKLCDEFKGRRARLTTSGAPAAPKNPIWALFVGECRSGPGADKVKK